MMLTAINMNQAVRAIPSCHPSMHSLGGFCARCCSMRLGVMRIVDESCWCVMVALSHSSVTASWSALITGIEPLQHACCLPCCWRIAISPSHRHQKQQQIVTLSVTETATQVVESAFEQGVIEAER